MVDDWVGDLVARATVGPVAATEGLLFTPARLCTVSGASDGARGAIIALGWSGALPAARLAERADPVCLATGAALGRTPSLTRTACLAGPACLTGTALLPAATGWAGAPDAGAGRSPGLLGARYWFGRDGFHPTCPLGRGDPRWRDRLRRRRRLFQRGSPPGPARSRPGQGPFGEDRARQRRQLLWWRGLAWRARPVSPVQRGCRLQPPRAPPPACLRRVSQPWPPAAPVEAWAPPSRPSRRPPRYGGFRPRWSRGSERRPVAANPGSASSIPRLIASNAWTTKARVSPLRSASRAERGATSPIPDSGT